MKTKLTLLATAALSATAQAHPGHIEHEDWPFPDVKWSVTLVIGALVIGYGCYKFIQKRNEKKK